MILGTENHVVPMLSCDGAFRDVNLQLGPRRALHYRAFHVLLNQTTGDSQAVA